MHSRRDRQALRLPGREADTLDTVARLTWPPERSVPPDSRRACYDPQEACCGLRREGGDHPFPHGIPRTTRQVGTAGEQHLATGTGGLSRAGLGRLAWGGPCSQELPFLAGQPHLHPGVLRTKLEATSSNRANPWSREPLPGQTPALKR